jgi:hypothetical protein
MKYLLIALCMVATSYAGITNSGTYSVNNGSSWGDMVNTETGVINAIRGKFTKLTNYGTAKLDSCKMIEEVTSFGTLTANDTQFYKTLTVGSGEAVLTSCQLENLVVVEPMNEHGSRPAQIFLKGNTVVNGAIEFQSTSGVVYKGPNVVVAGEIVNGMVLDLQE